MDGRLASAHSLRMAARVRLAVITPSNEALCNLRMFAFIASYLFSAGGRHSSAVAELLRLIERLEELHAEVQEMISPPHLSTTILYYASRRWIQYLNRCVMVLVSEGFEAPGTSVPFSLEPIQVDLEGLIHRPDPPTLPF